MTAGKQKGKPVSGESLAAKVSAFPRRAGRTVLEQALVLYLVMLDPRVPVWAKAVVAAALAYFISPLDGIPDLLPFVGFTDDGMVMAGALAQAGAHVNASHRREARKIVDNILGE